MASWNESKVGGEKREKKNYERRVNVLEST